MNMGKYGLIVLILTIAYTKLLPWNWPLLLKKMQLLPFRPVWPICLRRHTAMRLSGWDVKPEKKYQNAEDVQEWINSTRNEKFSDLKNIGALVMNCNPFTLGHYYLIERSIKQVDGLYVFILQEDKSFFSFEDRIRLVREGTASFSDKISIHASGNFIISSMSFPGYFAKEHAVKPADSTVDVLLFGAIIAPALGITRRFVGDEPNCLVTNSYNETMQFLLPPLGVSLHVIPRKEMNGRVISASSVRKCLQENNWDLVKEIVPPSTYNYLVEKYGANT